ncbi:MAG: glycine dehydrogenase (aminomethyl-transferring) [Pedosphaera sp.]|nr:glycine dehydrogenase (aminomethyl-transferring) [Pedosphaera sp.]
MLISLPAMFESQTSQRADLLAHPDQFVSRHIGPNTREIQEMLDVLGLRGIEDLVAVAVPEAIRTNRPLDLPAARGEHELLKDLRTIASRNKVFRSFIGLGYHDCITPPVIQRNVLENPGWYTHYTPYQAEISQGRLESLLNFQSMVTDLTGMQIANASLLDEGTAAAEAMTLCHAAKGATERNVFFISDTCHPQTIDVVRTRAVPLGIEVITGSHQKFAFYPAVFGALVQYPATDGSVHDYRSFIEAAHSGGALVAVAADLLSLTLLVPPGEFGADVVIGSAQRFGVPLGFGGPHAAFFATRDVFKRQMPGRLVGVSRDSAGHPAFRLALQTREQHIRRDKATSNICTAQALLANMAAMYAVYHGPEGLKRIAQHIRRLTLALADGLRRLGYKFNAEPVFDTLCVNVGNRSVDTISQIAADHGINLRVEGEDVIIVAFDETTTAADVNRLLQVFNTNVVVEFTAADLAPKDIDYSAPFQRTSPYLQHPVFNRFHSETEMLRYLRRLESRDLSLAHSMIPLGSCTMKLNATSQMFPVSWPEFSKLHPFAPADQTDGYDLLFRDLEVWLGEITGFPGVSLQPNAGSQGEYAGLLAIHNFHQGQGAPNRRICLIPQSAHGTNPASAVMAGMEVVPIACDSLGNVDLGDLRAKLAAHQQNLAALMITYPSTHGVFEEQVMEICRLVHEHGGQVYMDGANMNAQVGLCRPAELGADVCHLNLHKTFCIPHGGGGPGMGPICVAQHLIPFLPGHPVVKMRGRANSGAVSSAPWGSASILPISWMYIALMGGAGLTQATAVAILNANYIARRLESHFPVLYKGTKGMVAHECILDLREFKNTTAEDVAKRLMDYGFHAPTLSWPVSGTLMVEPTESESKDELDRFCDAMIAIHAEMKAVESGCADRLNNVLKNAPHTAQAVVSDKWDRPYPREQAAFPAAWTREHKFWPAVGRIDNVFGDRNLVCSCVGMEAYSS